MSPLAALLGLARAPFLPLTLVSVLLGLALAWPYASVDAGLPGRALLVLLGALAAHVSVNAFNEVHDFRSGLDLATRRTPFSGGSGTLPAEPRWLPLGRWLALGSLAVCLLCGLALLLLQPAARLPLLLIGGLGCLLILAYTPWLTRHPWLCLFAPGLAFGPLMVLGSQLAVAGRLADDGLLLALVPFCLANNLLLLNQYPDIDADRQAGRRTLPMLLPAPTVLALLGLHWLLAFALPLLLVASGREGPGLLLVLLLAPLAGRTWWRCRQARLQLPALLPALAGNVLLSLLLPLLLAVGLWLH